MKAKITPALSASFVDYAVSKCAEIKSNTAEDFEKYYYQKVEEAGHTRKAWDAHCTKYFETPESDEDYFNY